MRNDISYLRLTSIELVAFLLMALATVPAFAKIKEIKIHGYVTNVISPTAFEIEDYRINHDIGLQLEFDNPSPEISFRLEDLRVGTELEVRGLFDDETGDLQAKDLKIDMEQFKKVKETVILSRPPEGIEKCGSGWVGILYAGGQRVRISPEQTQVVYKLTSREKKILKDQNKKQQESAQGSEEAVDEYHPLSSLKEVTAGMVMTYEGFRNPDDGSILADRVEFSRNDLGKGEEQLRKRVDVTVKPGGSPLQPAEFRTFDGNKYELLPNSEVQQYVQKLGTSLIPKYQIALAENDPAKLHFHFWVVMKDYPNACALPDGVVLIHSGLFNILENEDQLAFVLGHEISHVIQKHAWREEQYHLKKLMAQNIGAAAANAFREYTIRDIAILVEAAIRNGYSRSLENQADRLGLEYMVEAGYDPREAPRSWKLMTKAVGLQATNFFWSDHDNEATRRSYLMNVLRNNYANLDYSRFLTRYDSFKQIVDIRANSVGVSPQDTNPSALTNITISSTPDAADVEVDDNFVGNTPLVINISPGDHMIAVRKRGFKPWERKLRAMPGTTRIIAELEKGSSTPTPVQAGSSPLDKQKQEEPLAPPSAPEATRISLWKAPDTGNAYSLKFDGDSLQIEAALSEEARKNGESLSAELKKQGAKYRGTLKDASTCQPDGVAEKKACSFQYAIELTTITPDKIEGLLEGPPPEAEFDCAKCSWSKSMIYHYFNLVPQPK